MYNGTIIIALMTI